IIRQTQLIQLEILLEINKICIKHNIKYILFGGTLLGSVRHSGFIPWDDDIDLAMDRENYDKFLKVAREEIDDRYTFQHYETDRKTIFPFLKIRKKGTKLIETVTENLDMDHGIFVDIFPLDDYEINNNKIKFKVILIKLINFIYRKSHR